MVKSDRVAPGPTQSPFPSRSRSSQPARFQVASEMAPPTNRGGGGHHGGRSCVSNAPADGGGSDSGGSSAEELDELWLSRPSKAAAMLAQCWVNNPTASSNFTFGLGGVENLGHSKIHLDGLDNLERTIGRDDITMMNLYALIETQGYSFRDSIYCRLDDDMVIIENNAQIYELLKQLESKKVLNLTVNRGRPKKVVAKEVNNVDEVVAVSLVASSVINYIAPVVFDLSPSLVYAVDDEGTVFPSQNLQFATQESRNEEKGKGIDNLDNDEEMDSDEDMEFDMGEADFNLMEEISRKEQLEVSERIEEMRQARMDPLLHREGDTDIEDLFVTEEVVAEPTVELVPVAEPSPAPAKKKLKRKGPTVRSHSQLIDDVIDWKPEPEADFDDGFLDDRDDDGYEPLCMVPPKGRKSRAKKRPPRKWYDERRLQAHEQLCLKMCFINVQQFRDALINLHIAQSRNFEYHRSG